MLNEKFYKLGYKAFELGYPEVPCFDNMKNITDIQRKEYMRGWNCAYFDNKKD